MKKLVFTLVTLLACVTLFDVYATDLTWDNPAGGDYLLTENWTPSGPPGAGDKAILDGALTGPIALGGNITNFSLQSAVNSGPITLDLAGKVLELRNYKSTTPYADWAFTCLANSSLTVTNSTSGGMISGLGDLAADSSSLFIDSGAMLTLTGADTLLELLQARVAAGGSLKIASGATVTLGGEPTSIRTKNYFYGNNPNDIVLTVDGTGSTYWDAYRYLQNSAMVVTNGGTAYCYRDIYVGRDGFDGKLVVSGVGSRTHGNGNTCTYVGSANSQGTVIVNQGGRFENRNIIACADNSTGEVFVMGEGTQAGTPGDSTYLQICDGNFTGAKGLLEVTDGALAYYRRFYMGKGGVIRLDDCTFQLVWGREGLATDLTYNRGGRIEGTGTIHNSSSAGAGRFEHDEGGVIAPGLPGLPIGTLTLKGWGTGASGAFTNGPTGMMEFEIASATSYDRLIFENSNFHLGGGTLTVTLLDGFQPSIGDTFNILDFDATKQSGTFEFVVLPYLGDDADWSTENLYVDGTISVVERELGEPMTYTWDYVDGGDYVLAGFWTPEGGPPRRNDTAVLAGTLPNPIFLSMARSLNTLLVSNATVTLDLNGYDLRVLNDASGVPYDQWGIYGHPGSVLTLINSGVFPVKFGGLGTVEDGNPNLFLAPNSQLTFSENVQAAVASARIADDATLRLNGGTLTTTSGSGVLVAGGTVTGDGLIESVAVAASTFINQGRVAPGPTGSATLTLAGFNSVSNAPDGELVFQIRSSVTAAENDRLVVTDGNLALGGTLRVNLGNFSEPPTNGATYNLIDWDTCSGTFNNIILPHWGTWSTDNLYVDGTISSAPYVPTPDPALTHVWTNAVGGDYMEGVNWEPYGPPGTNDTARLVASAPVLITLSDRRLTNDTLQVDGGPATLDLNGFSLPLRNFYYGGIYTNWGFTCFSGADLTVTNSGAPALIGTLGAALANSASLFIDEGAVLTLSGENTKLVGSNVRTRGGLFKIENGADVVLGSDPVRGNCYYKGDDTNAIAPFAIVDGSSSTYYCVMSYLDNGCFIVTNGGHFDSYRYVHIGTAGATRGGFRCQGFGSRSSCYELKVRNGYLHIEDGGTVAVAPSSFIGYGADSSGEVVVSGEGTTFDCGHLFVCSGDKAEWYPGSTGTLYVVDGGLAAPRYIRMQTNGVIRLDRGDISVSWASYDRRSIMQGGCLEGVGEVKSSLTSEIWFENLGGVIAPGLPGGTLSFINCNHLVNGPSGTIAFQIVGSEAGACGCLGLSNSTLELEGGTLRISLSDGYKPVRRTTYQLFDLSAGGNITGSFDSVELPKYGEWLLDNLYVDGTVTVNPGPASVMIIR